MNTTKNITPEAKKQLINDLAKLLMDKQCKIKNMNQQVFTKEEVHTFIMHVMADAIIEVGKSIY